MLENVINRIDNELRRGSKAQLIQQAADLVQLVQQVCRQPMPSLVTGVVPADFLRLLICLFYTRKLIIVRLLEGS